MPRWSVDIIRKRAEHLGEVDAPIPFDRADTHNDGNAVITIDASGDTITLTGVQAAALKASDFHLV